MVDTAVNIALIAVAVIVGAAIVWIAILSMTRATRLDHLNVRVDLADGALIAALERRAVVARAIAATAHSTDPGSTDPGNTDWARRLSDAATTAENAQRSEREAAENELSAALAAADDSGRPAALVAELADAQTRVMMARRFYNDAVRDARALAGRRMVRMLRLGGHSSPPDYFEISERVSGPA